LRSVVIMAMRYLAIGHQKRKAARPAGASSDFAGSPALEKYFAHLEY